MWKYGAIAFIGAFCTVVFVGWNYEAKPMSQRIEEACRREFGSQGEGAVTHCRIEVAARYILDQERQRLNSAYNQVK